VTLLAEIMAYLDANDISKTMFGDHVMNNTNFVHSIRLRGEHRLRNQTIQKVRDYMRDNPDATGILKRRVLSGTPGKKKRENDLPVTHRFNYVDVRFDTSDLTIVDRDPCFYCGARGDLACAHKAASTVK
jgi:hypothetical protein